MRVISGSARGTKLATLPGEAVTRPTIDRVKEAMFGPLQFILPGARVLDLFAGSGQLGIEALSRGASSCVFVDQSKEALSVITQNCHKADVFERSRIVRDLAQTFLPNTKDTFHVVLLDPPYGKNTLQEILPAVAAVTAPGGTIICESEVSAILPDACAGLNKKKQHRYGTVLVTRYEKERDE